MKVQRQNFWGIRQNFAELLRAIQGNISKFFKSFSEPFRKLFGIVLNLLQNECTIIFD